ncbi:hypothetical protein D3C71_998580 [compost metagenome]
MTGAWLVDDDDARRQGGAGLGDGGGCGGRRVAPVAEGGLRQFTSLGRGHGAREDDCGLGRAIAGGVEGGHVVAGDGRDAGQSAAAGRAVRGVAVDDAADRLGGDGAGLAEGHAQTVQGLRLLTLQLLGGEGRVAHQIRHQAQRAAEHVLGRVGVDVGEVGARARADIGAQLLDGGGDLGRRLGRRALGQQAGGQGCDAGLARRVVGRTGVEVQTGRDQGQALGRSDQDPHPVGQAEVGHRRRGRGDFGARLGQAGALGFRQQEGDRTGGGQFGHGDGGVDVHLLHAGRVGLVGGQVVDGDLALRRQIAAGHALHVGGGDGLDLGDLAVGGGRVAGHDQGHAQGGGAVVDALAATQGVGDQFVLGLAQFGGGDRRIAQAGYLGLKGFLAGLDRLAVGHDGVGGQVAGLLGEVGVGADRGGDLLVIDQRTIQAAGFAGRQHPVQDGQGGAVGVLVGHGVPGQDHGGQGHVGRVVGGGARAGRLGLLDVIDRHGRRRALQRGEILVHPGVQLGLIEVAGHDQHGVVGAVIGGVEAQHVVQGRGVQFLDRADAGAAIGVVLIDGLGREQAEQAAIGAGQNALAVFLLHHVALGGEGRLIDHQRAHAVGLGEEDALQVVGGDHLVIGGDVVGGEGVVHAADVLGQTVERLRRHVLGRLEQQVFEQVGEARTARRIILGAHAIPDLDRDVRGRGVAGGIDLHAVGQHALGKAQRRYGDPALSRGGDGGRRALGGGGGGQAQQQGRGAGGQDQAGLHGRQVPVAPQAAPGAGGRTLSGLKPAAHLTVL